MASSSVTRLTFASAMALVVLGSSACNVFDPSVLRVDSGAAASDASLDASVIDAPMDAPIPLDLGLDAPPPPGDGGPGDAGCGAGQHLCGTSCVDSRDPATCGDRCTPCPQPLHTTPTCEDGMCGVECMPDWGNCDGTPDCETSFTTAEHCGSCTTVCSGATPVCSSESGAPVCASGCGPSETRCGAICADLTSDARHCNECDFECPSGTGGEPACVDSRCVLECLLGYHSCESEGIQICADDTSPATCGTRCAPCPAPTNGHALCDRGSCDFACDSGYEREGSNCVISPPRPRSPLSTSIVGSRQPRLTWEQSVALSGVRIFVCSDRACVSPAAAWNVDDSTGSSVAPVSLTPGWYYWRMFARVGGATTMIESPTWQFYVPVLASAEVPTSLGSVADFNGDGLAETLVGSFGSASTFGQVKVYDGVAGSVPSTTASITFDGLYALGRLGTTVSSAGDVDGDGYADALFGAPYFAGNSGYVLLFYGSATGLETSSPVELNGFGGEGYFGSALDDAGDVDGDGYADFIVGANGVGNGAAFIYAGGPRGEAMRQLGQFIGGPAVSRYASAVAGLGDVDGDGYADVAVTSPNGTGSSGFVDIFLGGPGFATRAPIRLLNPGVGGSSFGMAVATIGDQNADGRPEIAIGAPQDVGGGKVYVYGWGPPGSAAPSTPSATIHSPSGAGGAFGSAIAAMIDLDGNGYRDFVVGAPMVSSGRGRIHVYAGSVAGIPTTSTQQVTGGDAAGRFGAALGGWGDRTGDGLSDLCVAAPYNGSMRGAAALYLGTAGGLSGFMWTVDGATSGDYLGYSVD